MQLRFSVIEIVGQHAECCSQNAFATVSPAVELKLDQRSYTNNLVMTVQRSSKLGVYADVPLTLSLNLGSVLLQAGLLVRTEHDQSAFQFWLPQCGEQSMQIEDHGV